MCVLAIGAAVFWGYVWTPLQVAAAHGPSFEWSTKGVIFAPLLLATGLLYTVMGNSAWRLMGLDGKPSKVGVALSVLVTATGIVLEFWLRAHLESLGYAIHANSLFAQ